MSLPSPWLVCSRVLLTLQFIKPDNLWRQRCDFCAPLQWRRQRKNILYTSGGQTNNLIIQLLTANSIKPQRRTKQLTDTRQTASPESVGCRFLKPESAWVVSVCRKPLSLCVLDMTPVKVYPVSFSNPLHLTAICCCDTANNGSSSKQTKRKSGFSFLLSHWHLCSVASAGSFSGMRESIWIVVQYYQHLFGNNRWHESGLFNGEFEAILRLELWTCWLLLSI